MNGIERQGLLSALAMGATCGDNIEYDSEYMALERLLHPFVDPMTGVEAAEAAKLPDWGDIRARALALLSRTVDLRVAFWLTRALLQTDGLVGLHEGLALIHRLLVERWDTLHPQLDPDDDNDPTLRINTLAALNDPETVIRELRAVPLVVSARFGKINYRDIALASGELTPINEETPRDTSEIKASFKECDAEGLLATASAARDSESLVERIEQVVCDHVGVGQAVDLSPIRSALRTISRYLDERVTERGLAGAEVIQPGGALMIDGNAHVRASPVVPAISLEAVARIASRDDVVRVLDMLCEYFQRNEPSSPVPILLHRAKQLVGKDFMEILRDLAPEGLQQAERFRTADGSAEASGG
ncbi:MAG: type VI secretion system protein TssA [Rhodospirillales bacterium]|nr:type VI secretion system protein TssA [Rhodospirillales bacterium]